MAFQSNSVKSVQDSGIKYELRLEVKGNNLAGSVNGDPLIEVTDAERPLAGGGIALIVEEGHLRSDAVVVTPLNRDTFPL